VLPPEVAREDSCAMGDVEDFHYTGGTGHAVLADLGSPDLTNGLVRVRARARRVCIGVADQVKKILGSGARTS
jgi:hypothetical protein